MAASSIALPPGTRWTEDTLYPTYTGEDDAMCEELLTLYGWLTIDLVRFIGRNSAQGLI